MSKNRVYMIMDNDEFREVTESEFAEEMDISPEGMEELTNKKEYITNDKSNYMIKKFRRLYN